MPIDDRTKRVALGSVLTVLVSAGTPVPGSAPWIGQVALVAGGLLGGTVTAGLHSDGGPQGVADGLTVGLVAGTVVGVAALVFDPVAERVARPVLSLLVSLPGSVPTRDALLYYVLLSSFVLLTSTAAVGGGVAGRVAGNDG